MVVQQLSGTKIGDLEASQFLNASSVTGRYGPYDYVIITGMGGSIHMNPIEYDGESVLLNPQYMNIGESYSFIFSGHTLVAIKQQDETIDFYYLD